MASKKMTDSDKLRTLATWFDKKYPPDDNEVQKDLRRIADELLKENGPKTAVPDIQWHKTDHLPEVPDKDRAVMVLAYIKDDGFVAPAFGMMASYSIIKCMYSKELGFYNEELQPVQNVIQWAKINFPEEGD